MQCASPLSDRAAPGGATRRPDPQRMDYDRLVEPHRPELRAHCYRMLGSAHDAEDALQETLLRAWRGLERFEGRSSLRSWLYAIATNVCLRMLERRPRLLLPAGHGPPWDPHAAAASAAEPAGELHWIEPEADARLGLGDGRAGPEARYEQRESVELAFIAALQHLPARQRAVLILRDVLGFSAREAAATLDTTPAAVDTALRRARASADERLPERSQQATLRTLGDRGLREIVDAFVGAWERADVDAVVRLLAHDAALTMPPEPAWFRGHAAIAAFLARRPLADRSQGRRLVGVAANAQPAFAHYVREPGQDGFRLADLLVLTLAAGGSRIAELTAFRSPATLEPFALPRELAR